MPQSAAAVAAQSRPRNQLGFFILLCFFFSGATGLIYQVVWTRQMELLFGATTYAVSALLTAFMAGLALGSALGGRWADRVQRPLLAYGMLELGIGAYALAFPAVFGLLHVAYREAAPLLLTSLPASIMTRFVLAFAVLIIPTTLMGATLPFLAKFVTAEESTIGVNVGRLYGTNTIGAVAGVLLSGFVLMPTFGQSQSILIAAATNLLLGVVCCSLGSTRTNVVIEHAPDDAARARVDEGARLRVATALFVVFCSGFASLLYEIVWVRLLVMVLGGSVYAFSIMLATFLIGLSLGALLIAGEVDRWGRRGPILLAALQGFTGVSVLVTGYFFEHLPQAFMTMFKVVPKLAFLVWLKQHGVDAQELTNLVIRFLISGAVMLPSALLIGGTFPAVMRLCANDLTRLGRSVGTVYSINTAGAILGSFSAGFLLIPVIGLQKAMAVGVLANLLSAIVVGVGNLRVPVPLRLGGVFVLAGLAGLLVTLPRKWNAQLIASGVYFHALYAEDDFKPAEIIRDRLENYELLHYKEGAVTTVTVEKYKPSGHLLLSNNGKIDASSNVDMPTQELVAHLPILWYQCARGKQHNAPPAEVALIGLASGVTAGSVLSHPGVKELHDIEIEPSMPEATRYFDLINNKPLDDPRMNLHLDDARNFLTLAANGYRPRGIRPGSNAGGQTQSGATKFDLIIAEPSNPWLSGVANLFTRDCFEIGKQALKQDGIYCQWIQFYSLKPREVKVLMRTFRSVFEHVYVFGVPPNLGEDYPGPDLVVLGSRQPLKLDSAKLWAAMRQSTVRRDLDRVNIMNPGDLVTLLRMGPNETRLYHGEGRLNTDDNMHIEYAAPRSLYDETYNSNFDEIKKFQTDPTSSLYLDTSGDSTERRFLLLDRVSAGMIQLGHDDISLRIRIRKEKVKFLGGGVTLKSLGGQTLPRDKQRSK